MTKNDISTYEPEAVLRYFYELSQIPRESGNEAGVQEYLIEFAKIHSLNYAVDSIGNVIIKKPASAGNEQVPSVAMQGHMDMVCVKDDDYIHDFLTDPIKLKIDGDILTAEGTTLGADNGIALAMVLAIFEDDTLVHGPLEGIFTISEETGLDGAFGLDISKVDSRRLINLDSEEEGIFYIGCAGGGEVVGTLEADWQPVPKGYSAWDLTLSGFLGGHSGAEIHTGRGNAIKSGVRFLKDISRKTPLHIASLNSGTKRNVIPSTFYSTFLIPEESEELIEQFSLKLQEAMNAELSSGDPNATISVEKTNMPNKVISKKQSSAVLSALTVTPHGIDAMSKTIEGLVETSNNLAITKLDDKAFSFTASQRSSITSARDEIEDRTATAFETCGATARIENKYPAWTPDPASAMAKLCADFYQEFTGKEPVITAIHAGLECGVINSKAKDMDSISFGPDLSGVHSTDEQMSLSSAKRIYDYLLALLTYMVKA